MDRELVINGRRYLADYWSPGGPRWTLLAGNIAGLDDTKTVLDIGCGSGAGGINLAIGTRAKVLAVDSESEYVELARRNAKEFGVEHLVSVEQAKLQVLAERFHNAAPPFDVVLAEGGVASYVGHEVFFSLAARLIKPGGLLVLSDLVFHEGISSAKYPLILLIPEPVRQFYRTGGYADSIQDRITQSKYEELFNNAGFTNEQSFVMTRTDWRAYYTNMQRHGADRTGPAYRDPEFARITCLDEAFYYTEAQKYMSYYYVIVRKG